MMQSNEEYLLLVLDKKTFFTTATTCEGVIIVYTSCHSFTNIREDKERPRSDSDESIGVVKYLFGPFYSRIFYCTIRIYYSSNIYIGVFPDCFSYVALNIMGIFPHISRWCYQGAVFFILYFDKSVALAGRCYHHPARFRHRNVYLIGKDHLPLGKL